MNDKPSWTEEDLILLMQENSLLGVVECVLYKLHHSACVVFFKMTKKAGDSFSISPSVSAITQDYWDNQDMFDPVKQNQQMAELADGLRESCTAAYMVTRRHFEQNAENIYTRIAGVSETLGHFVIKPEGFKPQSE